MEDFPKNIIRWRVRLGDLTREDEAEADISPLFPPPLLSEPDRPPGGGASVHQQSPVPDSPVPREEEDNICHDSQDGQHHTALQNILFRFCQQHNLLFPLPKSGKHTFDLRSHFRKSMANLYENVR